MGRNYIFRAWDEINKKWLLGYEYPALGGFSLKGEVMAFGEYGKMLNSFNLLDWAKINITQFTGAKDKNEKLIYEGDIIKASNVGIGLISWCHETYMFRVKWYDKAFSYVRSQNDGYNENGEPIAWNTHITSEVIGNIFENPELLEIKH